MGTVIVWLLGAIAMVGTIWVHLAAIKRPRVIVLLLILDVIGVGLAATAWLDKSTFRAWMQEDAWAEWGTFFTFLVAGVVTLTTALRWIRDREDQGGRLAGGLALCVAAFCLFVAGEEVSWGQRLFAFAPPEIFLEENFQQELNVHNFLKGKKIGGFKLDSRFLVAVIAFVYGVAGPAVAPRLRAKRLGPALQRVAPPVFLIPSFAAVASLELGYPVKLTGEACELFLGLLFLTDAVVRHRPAMLDDGPRSDLGWGAGLIVGSVAIGLVTPPIVSALVYGDDTELVAQTEVELAALRTDLTRASALLPKLLDKKRVHKRVYTATRQRYVAFAGGGAFLEGRRSPGSKDADPESTRRDRRGYFLDPWNNPYWIHYVRKRGRVTVYSFGPNRRRDTKLGRGKRATVMGGDDIAVTFRSDGIPD